MYRSLPVITLSLFVSAVFGSESKSAAVNAPLGTLIVGVIEQPHCRGPEISARLFFSKQGERWTPITPEQLAEAKRALPHTNWTIGFDGRNRGTAKLLGSTYIGRLSRTSPRVPDELFELASPQDVRVVRNDDGRFAGWCHAPALRPLALVSRPNFRDPDGWKPFQADGSYKKRLYGHLKPLLGDSIIRCNPETFASEPWDFTAENLTLSNGYRSASGRELVSVRLQGANANCDFIPGKESADHVFLLDGSAVRLVGFDMELVDAGDYDADGRSELLFWTSGYNRNGYALVYDDLREVAVYEWSYH